ncbi:MAG: AAA family ATPase, partial [Clostridia bacterium]|nr:AAA family ATPase [Clostridia bacterium]
MICSRCKKRPAVVFITRMENGQTLNDGLCLFCARELNIKPVNDMMEKMGLSDEDLEQMSGQLDDMMQSLTAGEQSPDEPLEGEDATEEISENGDSFKPGGAATFPLFNGLFGGRPGKQTPPKKGEPPKRRFLSQYCTDLTEKARSGKIDTIIGRDREIYRVVQILCRRTKNNPCLIGEPGVGKTAIAEGLALRIAAGDVPYRLRDKEIHLLDLTALVAGTQFRGQFESRIMGLIDEVRAEGNIILFIDEVHTLSGTGDSEGSMSAANILKPSLSRGEIQVIG